MMLNKKKYSPLVALLPLIVCFSLHGLAQQNFPISTSGRSTALFVDASDHEGVKMALDDLRQDITNVSGTQPELVTNSPSGKEVIIIGSLDKSKLINQLVQSGKLDVRGIKGKWEAYKIQVVEKPYQGADRALVIVGSDMRGTIFGIYEISKQIGVSPWFWWADVPVRKNKEVFFPSQMQTGSPKVKLRGIFINDEAPALWGWAAEKFGGFNHKFYDKVYELILRLKGNFLWPAMWGRAIYDDDSLSAPLANRRGIIIGTSHHEPLMRAHVEWERYGVGEWNYEKNDSILREFWRKGLQRMGKNQSVVTLAMRGDGDMAMSKETNVALLERIVRDQREIIKEETGKIDSIPQVWALYKEVQDYYDEGMRVPDDVTLLLCDDNWGNIRKLPKLSDPPRKGNYGIYYHFDYVGGPRNYKWLNTNQVSRVWEQMNLAWQHNVNRLWIVNVGDIKPMEYPISFFLDMAWDPDRWSADNITNFTKNWSQQQFGEQHASAIASMLLRYTNYNARRKPELLSPETYSLINFGEADRIVSEYQSLADEADSLYQIISPAYKDAFYQLVYFPIQACANLNLLYVTAAKNRLYASQKRALTNKLADSVTTLFARDAELTKYHNEVLADGKWSHMMDQTHIGYTYWQQPPNNIKPQTQSITLPKTASPAFTLEGTTRSWSTADNDAVTPVLDPYDHRSTYLDLFNRGTKAFQFYIRSERSWLKVGPSKGKVATETRLQVEADWSKVPIGMHDVQVTVKCAGHEDMKFIVKLHQPGEIPEKHFIESNGYVSFNAAHASRVINSNDIRWKTIPDVGRNGQGVSAFPVTASVQRPAGNSPHLEYDIYLFNEANAKVNVYLSPTLNYHVAGLRYAISIDDEEPQVVDVNGKYDGRTWNGWVANNMNIQTTTHAVKPGKHTVKFWLIDPGLVLQKIVVETGPHLDSYLGPPESFRK